VPAVREGSEGVKEIGDPSRPSDDLSAAMPPAVREGSEGVKELEDHQINVAAPSPGPTVPAVREGCAFSGRYHSPFPAAAPPSRDRPKIRSILSRHCG
jgi:hypothetical protein